MQHHERPATALAHGPAKPDDIERARRDVTTAEAHDPTARDVERAVGELEVACQSIHDDLDALRRALATKARPTPARDT
jgi:hypothetical protein